MNYLAPSGTPIKISHLAKWIGTIPNNQYTLDSFSEKVRSAFNVKHCMFISSGRTALYLILQCLYEMQADSNRNEVIVPSYTCFSVPGSVAKAGLKVRICDIDPNTLSYDTEKLNQFDFSNVLAIVTSNLYGIPNDLPSLEEIANNNNIFLVDDAAQSMGATINGKASGTYGDIGLYSLDKGKNITSIQGGIIVTDSDEIAGKMKNILCHIPTESTINVIADCIKLLIYTLLLPPNRYWFITKIPFLKLGLTPYTTDYPVHQYSPMLCSIASLLFDELSTINSTRVSNAHFLIDNIQNISDFQIIDHSSYITPVYLRLPILVNDSYKRDKLIKMFVDNGIGATNSYPSSIADIDDIQDSLNPEDKDMPGGRKVANQIVTLPTNPYMNIAHREKINNILKLFN